MQGLIVSCFALACSGLGVLLAWVTRWSEAAFFLLDICTWFPLVPSCALRAYQQEGGVPNRCGERYQRWEMSWNGAFYGLWFMTDSRLCQSRPDRYGFLSMTVDVPQNISVVRVKESWEGDEFSSPQAALAVFAVSSANAFWAELVWRRRAPLTARIYTSGFKCTFSSSLPVSLQMRWNLFFSPAILMLPLASCALLQAGDVAGGSTPSWRASPPRLMRGGC